MIPSPYGRWARKEALEMGLANRVVPHGVRRSRPRRRWRGIWSSSALPALRPHERPPAVGPGIRSAMRNEIRAQTAAMASSGETGAMRFAAGATPRRLQVDLICFTPSRARNQDALDVAGAFVNLRDSHVAVDAFDGKSPTTVTAVDLDWSDLEATGGEEFGHRCSFQARRPCPNARRQFIWCHPDLRGRSSARTAPARWLKSGWPDAPALGCCGEAQLSRRRRARHYKPTTGNADAPRLQ